MFEMYQDPKIIPLLISLFSILTTFTIWAFVIHLFKLSYYFKFNKVFSSSYVWSGALGITFINWLGVDINLYFIIPAYLLVTYLSYQWIPVKSLKWINLSTALFILFIIVTYAFFNYKIHYITYIFFSSNDILEYSFKFKPYFLIYHVGDFLGSVSFVISNKTVTYTNEPLQYRIYLFYYALNFIGLVTWLWIYCDVLKKHKFDYTKPYKIGLLKQAKKETTSPSLTIENSPQEIVKAISSPVVSDISSSPVSPSTYLTETSMTSSTYQTSHLLSQLEKDYNATQEQNIILKEKILLIKEKELNLTLLKHQLSTHSIFKSLKTMDDLRLFMEQHVYCVWDFMSLLKRLQRDICSTSVPWMPPKNGFASRLINDIVLGEESDILPDGSYASHFTIYLDAMKEVGANTQNIHQFIYSLEQGMSVEQAINLIPEPVQSFVKDTMNIALKGSVYENLGSFFNGRENVIPDMFSSLLNHWSIDQNKAPMFHYYLVRHIELDGDEHGPAGEKLIHSLISDNVESYIELLDASILSVRSRIQLWDKLSKKLQMKSS